MANKISHSLLAVTVFLGLTFSYGYPVVSKIDYQGVACEGTSMQMFCPPGYLLDVTSARWGRDNGDVRTDACDVMLSDEEKDVRCAMGNILTVAKILCDGKIFCDILASAQTLGDTCQGSVSTKRFLRTSFTCRLPIYKVLACEASGVVPLECPPGRVIEGISAFYGRDKKPLCPHDTAIERTNCSSNTATDLVKELCDKRQRCEINPINNVFGDPCPGTYKYLQMQYSCVECRNLESDGRCEYLALKGECESNPLWMIPHCRKTCSRCDGKEPKCVNYRYSDANCTKWANENQCKLTPAFMLSYCRKACGLCNPEAAECKDLARTTGCKYWASTGECSKTPKYMTDNCMKSCSNCKVDDTTECKNIYSDARCQQWVDDSQCQDNPLFMLAFCRKACTNCHNSTLNMIGHYARPGRIEPSTAEYTVILADEFTSDARLTHFSAFFSTKHTILLEVWRPNSHRFYYDLVYSVEVKPMDFNSVQTITPESCLMVKKGDRIGFSSKSGTSPIAFHFNLAQLMKRTAFRTVGVNGRFDEIPYPYVFSLGASYDPELKCL